MQEIPLTQGYVAHVDDADYEWLSQFSWRACRTSTGNWYAQRTTSMKLGKRQSVFMHREIMQTPLGKDVDHIDGNGLNCQRENMRNCEHRQNQRNQFTQKVQKHSIFKGVTWHKQNKMWLAQIMADRKHYFLGLFKPYVVEGTVPYDKGEVDAALCYDEAARKHFGEFAKPNFIEV